MSSTSLPCGNISVANCYFDIVLPLNSRAISFTLLLLVYSGFIGEGKSALTDEEIAVLVSCADKDGNGTFEISF